MNLNPFLSQKPLFYDAIDVERFPKAYRRVRGSLAQPKIIHIVGTNGKGSTGRFLAVALHRAGKKTGHYTSPHIMRFNERIWIDGADIDESALEESHQKLLSLLDPSTAEALSYFEYTTLLAMIAFAQCEYVVLEAGLGGEFDATNAFDKRLSIFTPIDFDHAAFLGNTIDSIAATKLRSMENIALLGKQKHPEVEIIARTIAEEKGCRLHRVEELVTIEQESLALRLALKNGLSDYLRDNLELAMAGYALLGYEVKEELFDQSALFGRLSKILPNVTLDVGHNALAARAIAEAYAGKKVTLVYNTYADKDYREILAILRPIIELVEIIEVEEGRIVERGLLEAALRDLEILYAPFSQVLPERNYLVFGSFSVAEAFIRQEGK